MDERGISKREVETAIALGVKGDAPGGIRIATYETQFRILVVKYQIIDRLEINVVTTFYSRNK